MPTCNDTLAGIDDNEVPLWKGFTFHHFGLFLAAIFGLISVIISLFLIMQHATHYIKPGEQKQIIRIVFMIPVYSIVSFLSYLFWRQSIYFEVLRDCYEAFAISSFFALMCDYVAPNLHDQKDFFRSITPKNWFLSFFGLQKCTGGENRGPLRKPRSGLTWFNIIWVGIFQYCFIRVFFTIVAVTTQAFDLYCESSLSPAFAHVWTVVFECLSVTVAMTMVVQFYIQLKEDLAEHKPGLKVLSIKLVIFFSFWQTIVISLLSSTNGPLHPSDKLSYPDIKVGIPSVLLCIEMAGFSILHLFAYPWKPYSIKHSYNDPLTMPGNGLSGGGKPRYLGGPLGIKALLDAFNPWDIIKASARGFRWLFVGYRHRLQDSSYQPAKLAGATTNTGYTGPSFASTLEPATELRINDPSAAHSRASDHHHGQAEDDRAGLLRNSQTLGTLEPYRPYAGSHGDEYSNPAASHSDLDLGAHPSPLYPHRASASGIGLALSSDMKSSDYGGGGGHANDDDDDYDGRSTRPAARPPLAYDDPGFHPGMGPPPGSAIPTGLAGGVHPAYRPGGAASPTPPAERRHLHQQTSSPSPWPAPYPQSIPDSRGPPSYRSYDPHAQ